MADLSSHSDRDLSLLISAGDVAAYTEVFERYHALLYVHAVKKFGDREQARDMVQEVFAMLWSNRERMAGVSNLAGYLYTSVHHRLLNWLERRGVESRFLRERLQELSDAGSVAADERVRVRQLSEIIRREIDALPPRMRQVFVLSRYEQLSHMEIALRLGITEESVRSHVKGALKVLRGRLGLFWFLVFVLWY